MSYFILKDGATRLFALRDAPGDGDFALVEAVTAGGTLDFVVGEHDANGGTALTALIEVVP
jgi:hypothetical protein